MQNINNYRPKSLENYRTIIGQNTQKTQKIIGRLSENYQTIFCPNVWKISYALS